MKRVELLQQLQQNALVAVVRSQTEEEGLHVSEALIENGIKAIEVTLTTPNALSIISELQKKYEEIEGVIIGAGTVLDVSTASNAIYQGASFIISPVYDQAISKLCNLYQIPYIPGCMSVSEMKEALESGVDVIKLFPSHVYDPAIIKSIKSPLPQITLMPSGGINLSNITQWLESGAAMISVGGELTRDVESVENMAQAYLDKLVAFREKE